MAYLSRGPWEIKAYLPGCPERKRMMIYLYDNRSRNFRISPLITDTHNLLGLVRPKCRTLPQNVFKILFNRILCNLKGYSSVLVPMVIVVLCSKFDDRTNRSSVRVQKNGQIYYLPASLKQYGR